MRKLLLLFSVLTFSSVLFAQTISEGFYRVKNNGEGAYIYVNDNTGSISQPTQPELGAVDLAVGRDQTISDPASIIYVEHISGNEYDLRAQGTGVHDIIGIYTQIIQSNGAYRLGAHVDGYPQQYLGAKPMSEGGRLSTVADRDYKFWTFESLSSNGSNYFGIKPTIQIKNKYYRPFYAEFAFSLASSGMKAYYVSETQDGYAKLEEITSGTIPGATPVIIECSSSNPSNNRLEIKTGGSYISDNILRGVYFCNTRRGNVTRYDRSSMRVLGVTSDGKLGFVTSDENYIPANCCYLPVPFGTPSSLEAVTAYPGPVVEAEEITLDKSSIELLAGETETLTPSIYPSNTTDLTVTWKSTDSSVARVNSNGVVTGVGEGTAIITATCGSVSATCTVTVKEIYAESVILDKTSIEMTVGDVTSLTATVLPENTSYYYVYWTTSDHSVARVYEGEVIAVAAGTATITARCGDVSATCEVTVKPLIIEAESVVLNEASLELIEGDTAELTATVKPDNTTDKTVIWTTSDETVATVAGGVVTAIAEGTAIITATCGEVSATCEVTVKPLIILADSITLDKIEVELIVGEKDTLTAVVLPENVTDSTIVWATSDETVATVADGVVTAIAEGTATITATCGEVSAACEVMVKPLIIFADSITLDKIEVELIVGEKDTLTAVVSPENVTDSTIVWATSDETVATVADGVVTAIAEGTATITATCGEVSAACVVTVKPEETSINAIVADSRVCGVYSVLGLKLREDTSIEDLPAGIYIVNGKKIVKR